MEIQVWADFHCPYCYMGIARLKKALRELDVKDARITLRSYLLDPQTAPDEDTLIPEYVARTYGARRESVRRGNALLERRGRELGLAMDLEKSRFTDMLPAHRLLQHMKTKDLGEPFFELAQKALFEEGALLSGRQTLAALAEKLGAAREETLAVLEGDRYREDVFAEYQQALDMDIDYVPFYLFESGETMSGERSLKEYLAALRRARGE